jgi:hypothetical protein
LGLIINGIQQPAMAQISAGGTPPSFSLRLSGSPPTIQMPRVDVPALMAEDEQTGNDPYRFAAAMDVALNLKNSGRWEMLPGGDRLWRLRISSPGAFSIGLLYDDWYIPKGGQLFIYNDDHSMVIGALTSFNNWEYGKNITQHVAGDATTLEYFEPASIAGRSRLSIYQVCHAYRNLFGKRSLDSYGWSLACERNVNCPEGAPWQDEKRGVAMIIHANTTQCSGSLIRPFTLYYTAFPYLLTANHCYVSGDSLWIFYFNYESPGCPNQNGPLNQTMANARLVARWATSDFALYQLSSVPPVAYNLYLNGWYREDEPSDSSVCIHHPQGDIKKISFDDNSPDSAQWFGADGRNHWRVNHWALGTTEFGSSGSPLLDAHSGIITGQLHGYMGPSCDCSACSSYFGKIFSSWEGGGTPTTRLKDWLDPDSSRIDSMPGAYFYAPENDYCPGFTIASLPYSTSGSTFSARNDFYNCVSPYSQDVFYNYTPPCDMTITVSLCGSSYDTGLEVLRLNFGSCQWFPMMVACNDNNPACADSLHSQLTFEAYANGRYLIDIHGAGFARGGYSLTVTGANHIPADSCPGETIAHLPYVHIGDTRCSINNFSNCVGVHSLDEVFNYTATDSQTVVVSLCGSGYDTGLEIRTGGDCPGNTQVACNDDDNCADTLNSRVTFHPTAGLTYYIIVHGWDNRSGPYRLDVHVQPKPEKLVVQASPPVIQLNWARAEGALFYNVYRDSSATFVPSTGNLIGTTTDTLFVDTQALTLPRVKFFYVVTAEEPLEGASMPERSKSPAGEPKISPR